MKRIFTTFLLILIQFRFGFAQDQISVSPITDQLLSIFIDDGYVEYAGTANADAKVHKHYYRADLLDQSNSYWLSSSGDPQYAQAVGPLAVGRKSIGTEYSYQGVVWSAGKYVPAEESWSSEHRIFLRLPQPLKSGEEYTLDISALEFADHQTLSFIFEEENLRSETIHVNTIGYAEDALKFGYLYQWAGSLGAIDLSAYEGAPFYVLRESGGQVLEGTVVFRKAKTNVETGQPEETPDNNFLGADVYEADFSALTAAGVYRLVVPKMGCSYPFKIGQDPLWEAYYATARAIYHQRSGIRIEASYGGQPYIRPITQNPFVNDPEGHSYQGQILYSDFPYMQWDNADNGGNNTGQIISAAEGNVLNVAGWYQDAGDWDGYSHHQRVPMTLMTMYEFFPQHFGDNEYDIPESGNGIPDLIDEASWLVKFNFRLRKALMEAGYSDGGLGGARVCADPYNNTLGNPEHEGTPSWQDHRPTLVTQADAFMTYMYAGEAAQLAIILKKLGRNPEEWPVEMLDAQTFDAMTKVNANWVQEAITSFEWAADPANQPASGNNYPEDLYIYRTYAAVNLFRLTGEQRYHRIAEEGLNRFKNAVKFTDDQRFSAYTYLLADQLQVNQELQDALKSAALTTAANAGMKAAEKRATRWGGLFDMPMLVGQSTTPWMFETMVAYALSGDQKYKEVVHTTADYFLGTNPRHSTNMTGVGPRPILRGFNLDGRTITENWGVFPGWIPYGPWAFTPKEQQKGYTHTMADGIERLGGQGPWSEHWHNFSMTPTVLEWPGHERMSQNVISPMHMENTIHQNSLHAAIAYGFVNGRVFTNSGSVEKVGSIHVSESEIDDFQYINDAKVIAVSLDNKQATQPMLVWSSSEESVAHVDQFGRITALADGQATITVQTLDGSVASQIRLTNQGLQQRPVEEVKISFEGEVLEMLNGSTKKLTVEVLPEGASDKTVSLETSNANVVRIEEEDLIAMAVGEAIITVRSNSNTAVFDEIRVRVNQANYTIIADFDAYIPVFGQGKLEKQVEIYSDHDQIDYAADNPLKNGINASEKVLAVERGGGQWKLFGFSSPTLYPYSTCQHLDFSFDFLSQDLNEIYYQITTVEGGKVDGRLPITPSDQWQTLSLAIPDKGKMDNFSIFANPEAVAADYTVYFDNFRLKQAADTEACGQEHQTVYIDFEQSNFNWQDGNGSFGWNGEEEVFVSEVVDNVQRDGDNGSDRVYHFEKTGTNFGGGFGLQTASPISLGNNNEFFLQMLSEVRTENIALKLIQFDQDGKEQCALEVQQMRIDLAPYQWSTFSFPVHEMIFSTKNDDLDREDFQYIHQIIIQPDVGAGIPNHFYVDNIGLGLQWSAIQIVVDKAPVLEVTEECQLEVEVDPRELGLPELQWFSSNLEVATVDPSGKVVAVGAGEAIVSVEALYFPHLRDEISIKVTPIEQVPPLKVGSGQIKLYPNPVSTQLHIYQADKIREVEIFNLLGNRVCKKEHLDTHNIALNLKDLKTGIYIVRVVGDQKQCFYKRILKK
ncbi:Ig-like domain-containing protein [Persicobacter diffluens]|uniref:BIG2 domain-containing protein n=1 Tax=Persicobacter diffluens TaxID=981 RepID=A0AAN4W3E0_9BACT|nr:hypothetical protein PEDI_49390 [Persicobacter diffluens]